MCGIFTIITKCGLQEIFVDFLFRSLVMLVCIILCNKLFTVNHNIKGIYMYLQERKRREIVLIYRSEYQCCRCICVLFRIRLQYTIKCVI